MMILRKPISILTAILFLTSSMVFSASETTDSLQVATAPATTEVEAHGEHAEEAKSPKEVVNAHIQHHLQDDYYFTFYKCLSFLYFIIILYNFSFNKIKF